MVMAAQKALQFDRFTIDPNAASLIYDGRQITLRPKSFDVLVHLARNAGRIVSKDELMEAVWPNVFVTDNSLVQCISEIRVALRDEDQAILKTVARRGYLFASPVIEIESGTRIHAAGEMDREPAPVRRESPASSYRRTFAGLIGGKPLQKRTITLVAGLALLPIVGAALWAITAFDTPALEPAVAVLPNRPSIAVLPFDDFGGDPLPPGLGDGLADYVISSLSKTPKMLVIARNSTFAYKGKAVNVQQISQELGARYVLEGSVQRSGSTVRVSTQLADAASGYHVWSETYDRDLGDVFALQDEITLDVVTALQIELTQGELARIRQQGTSNLQAWLLVNQSFEHLLRFTKEDNERARQLAEEALQLDPNYAEAYVRLGRTHLVDFHSGGPPTLLPHCIRALKRRSAHSTWMKTIPTPTICWAPSTYI